MSNSQKKLTVENLRSAVYFINDHGDITRWSSWEELKPLFEREFPGLTKAIEKIERAKDNMANEVTHIEDRICELEDEEGAT